MKIYQQKDEILEIGLQAHKEWELQRQIRDLIVTWSEKELPLKPYEQICILDDIEEITTALDESLI